jgi:hypothetical protein
MFLVIASAAKQSIAPQAEKWIASLRFARNDGGGYILISA